MPSYLERQAESMNYALQLIGSGGAGVISAKMAGKIATTSRLGAVTKEATTGALVNGLASWGSGDDNYAIMTNTAFGALGGVFLARNDKVNSMAWQFRTGIGVNSAAQASANILRTYNGQETSQFNPYSPFISGVLNSTGIKINPPLKDKDIQAGVITLTNIGTNIIGNKVGNEIPKVTNKANNVQPNKPQAKPTNTNLDRNIHKRWEQSTPKNQQPKQK